MSPTEPIRHMALHGDLRRRRRHRDGDEAAVAHIHMPFTTVGMYCRLRYIADIARTSALISRCRHRLACARQRSSISASRGRPALKKRNIRWQNHHAKWRRVMLPSYASNHRLRNIARGIGKMLVSDRNKNCDASQAATGVVVEIK